MITNAINKNSIHFCFRFHSHTISHPNKQLLVPSHQQKCQKQGVKEGHRPQYGDFIANSHRLYPQRPHR